MALTKEGVTSIVTKFGKNEKETGMTFWSLRGFPPSR